MADQSISFTREMLQFDPQSFAIDRKSPIPYYLQVKEAIISNIESGSWTPGFQLPGEPELCRVFNVSRTVIRHALQELTYEGLIIREKGVGTFVAKQKLGYQPSTSISFSRRMVDQGHTVSTKVLDQCIDNAPANIVHELQLEPGTKVVYIRRLRLVDDRPVAIHTSYLPTIPFGGMAEEDLTGSFWDAVRRVSGIEDVYARDVIDACLLHEDEATLLECQAGSPALLMRGVAFDVEGTPFRYTKAVFRADLLNFSIDGGLMSISLEDR